MSGLHGHVGTVVEVTVKGGTEGAGSTGVGSVGLTSEGLDVVFFFVLVEVGATIWSRVTLPVMVADVVRDTGPETHVAAGVVPMGCGPRPSR